MSERVCCILGRIADSGPAPGGGKYDDEDEPGGSGAFSAACASRKSSSIIDGGYAIGLIGKLDELDEPFTTPDDEELSEKAGRAPVSISEMDRCFRMGFIPPLLLAEPGVVEVEDDA